MTIHQLTAEASPALKMALETFEQSYTYPLGKGRRFRVSHETEYSLFFRALGRAVSLIAVADSGEVVGTISVAVRDLLVPDSSTCAAAYLANLKVAPGPARGRTLLRLAREATAWALAEGAICAYAIVMNGTERAPTAYTGRFGLHAFQPVGEVALLLLRAEWHEPQPSFAAAEDDAPFRTLSAGCYAPLGGQPTLRSQQPPQWLQTPDGSACAVLEDTRRAKRLWLPHGRELSVAHLSRFAWRDPLSALALIREAQARCRNHAFFFSVPAEALSLFIDALPEAEVAMATIYATGLPSESGTWMIGTSEI